MSELELIVSLAMMFVLGFCNGALWQRREHMRRWLAGWRAAVDVMHKTGRIPSRDAVRVPAAQDNP